MSAACEHPRCPEKKFAEPQITENMLIVHDPPRRKKDQRQPRWFCKRHSPLYPVVTFWGEVRRPAREEVRNATSQS